MAQVPHQHKQCCKDDLRSLLLPSARQACGAAHLPASRKMKAWAVISISEKCWSEAMCLEPSMCFRKLPGASAFLCLGAAGSAACCPALTSTSTFSGATLPSAPRMTCYTIFPAVSITTLRHAAIVAVQASSFWKVCTQEEHTDAVRQRDSPAACALRASFISCPTTLRSFFLACDVCTSTPR